MEAARRNAGRWLLTLAGVITIGASVAADWNDSHVFNQRWPSHARYHEVVALAMTATLSGLAIVALWTDTDGQADRRVSGRGLAAAVPVAYWGSFFRRCSCPAPASTTSRTR